MRFFSNFKTILLTLILSLSFLLFVSGKEIDDADTVEAPLSLTAGDGAGLILKNYESNTVLDGFIAFTEIKLSFYNPENRQREGRFRITLPDNAHLARFAMMIDNKWQEGEVVEKEKAVRAYEDFLHRKQDPALLESDAGNEFSARIFPIPAKADKQLIISYSTILNTAPPKYTIPLIGLPEIENFKITVIYDEKEFQAKSDKKSVSNIPESDETTINRKVFSVKKNNYKPDKNFSFEHAAKGNLYLKNDKIFAFHFIPFKEKSKDKFKTEKAVILVDTSASATPEYARHIDKVEDLIRQLSLKEVEVFGFDNDLKESEISDLKKRIPLGASNLYSAIKGIGTKTEFKDARLIIVSDCVPTAGILDKGKFTELIKSQKWISRVDVIIPSSYKEAGVIGKLITSAKNPGISANLSDDTEELVNKLQTKVFTDNKISIENTKWFYPDSIDSIQSREPVVVFGELKDSGDDPAKLFKFNNSTIENFALLSMDELLLEREAMAARINKLIDSSEKEQNEDMQSGLILQARELSIKHRIQSPYTSFLVLETEADYARFQITRNSLTNILTIGMSGLEVINRRDSKLYEFLDNPRVQNVPVEENNNTSNSVTKAKKKSGSSTAANGNAALDDMISTDRDEFDSRDGKKDKEVTYKKEEEKREAPKPSATPISAKADIGTDREKDSKPVSGKSLSKPTTSSDAKISIAEPEKQVSSPTITNEETIIEIPERTKRRLESIRPPRIIRPEPQEKQEKIEPYTGNMKKFYSLIDKGDYKKAYDFALNWRTKHPEEALALVALGDAAVKTGNKNTAIRSYTSLVDYFPMRADIRRWAGQKLMSMGEYDDSIDTLQIALKQRPDHPSTYHLLVTAYLKNKEYKNAAMTALAGINYNFDSRFDSVHDILYDDLDLAYTMAMKTNSKDMPYFNKLKTQYKMKTLSKEIRFILVWETDANDVDFHIYDKQGNHAFYSAKQLATGGELYADLTGGYGPECFRIIKPEAFPYKLEAHYYSRGPMGYGMGAVQIIKYDGDDGLVVETRSYLIMNDGAFLNLGTVSE